MKTAPEVRLVRSPWSAQSGGHGLKANPVMEAPQVRNK